MLFVGRQTLVAQLKDSIPGMEAAVGALRDQVNSTDMVNACLAAQSALSSPLPHETRHLQSVRVPFACNCFIQFLSSAARYLFVFMIVISLSIGVYLSITQEGDRSVEGDEAIYGLRPLELVPPSPALKLPQLLSTSPSSLEKIARLQKRFSSFSHIFPLESLREEDVRSMATSIAGSSIEDGSGMPSAYDASYSRFTIR